MTAAERVQAYLDTRTLAFPWAPLTIDYTVDNTHEEHTLTASDLRELLTENASLRAQDREGQLRVAEAYRDAFGLRPWEIQQINEQEARRQA